MPGYVPSSQALKESGGTTLPLGSIGTHSILYRGSAASVLGLTLSGATGSLPLYNGTSIVASVRAWAIGATSTTGLSLDNTTAAGSGAQQYSPAIHLGGNGYKTDATAGSQSCDWKIENQPVQGTSAPSTTLAIKYSINAGAYANGAYVTSAGVVCGTGYLLAGTSLYIQPNVDYSTGLGACDTINVSADLPLLFRCSNAGRDAASAVVVASCFDRNAATVTNAATMRLHSFGWTNNAGAYTELAAVYCDGKFACGQQGIGTTSTAGLSLDNATAAAAGAQQYSPALHLGGNGWKTDATAASVSCDWKMEVQPVQGAAAPTSALHFLSSIGGAYASKANLDSSGILTASQHTAAGYVGANSNNIQLYRVDRSSGLGTTSHVHNIGGSDYPLGLLNGGRSDGASQVVCFSCWDIGTASITNAATMRLHSFGWTNDSDAYTELFAVYCDGHTAQTVAASASSVVGRLLGTTNTEGLQTKVQEETLSPTQIETSMATAIPAGSVIRAVLANCQSALTGGGTTVTWSVGTAADPDKYGTAGYPSASDSLAKNSKSNWIGATQVTSAETIVLTGAATGGDADGNTALTNGSVRIMVIFDTYDAMADAA